LARAVSEKIAMGSGMGGISKCKMRIAELLAKSMSSNRKGGDKSLFPTTIVMLVSGSIKQRNPNQLFATSSAN
jgi:hypothetical protein